MEWEESRIHFVLFQFWVMVSFIVMHFWLGADTLYAMTSFIRVAIGLTSLIAINLILRTINPVFEEYNERQMKTEDIDDEELSAFSHIIFGLYLVIVSLLVGLLSFLNFAMVYKYLAYKMTMGLVYFYRKRAFFRYTLAFNQYKMDEEQAVIKKEIDGKLKEEEHKDFK